MNLQLGKRPAREDPRTLKLKLFLTALPTIPYEFDLSSPLVLPTPMFANDSWGDCVIAGRAHQTLRFEACEQNKLIEITDDDVLREYWKEGRRFICDKRPDRGLVLLDSLTAWRKRGWYLDRFYNIYAFGKVNPQDVDLVRATLYLFNGANIGLSLPLSAKSQFNKEVWHCVPGQSALPGSWGGHCVHLKPKCDYEGLYCVTWGKEQKMTWDFLFNYCDEFYGVLDNKNWADSPLDVEKLNSYLAEIVR